jgi:hypothetical protein
MFNTLVKPVRSAYAGVGELRDARPAVTETASSFIAESQVKV